MLPAAIGNRWSSAVLSGGALRVNEASLAGVEAEEFDAMENNWTSQRVRRFLKGLRKDIGK